MAKVPKIKLGRKYYALVYGVFGAHFTHVVPIKISSDGAWVVTNYTEAVGGYDGKPTRHVKRTRSFPVVGFLETFHSTPRKATYAAIEKYRKLCLNAYIKEKYEREHSSV